MSKNFNDLLIKAASTPMKRLSVAVAQDEPVLEAVCEARRLGIANAILVGDKTKIEAVAANAKLDISGMQIIDEPDDYAAALLAVKLVHNGEADMYMKGLIDSRSFLRTILNKEVGLRTERLLSHVSVFDLDGRDHLLFLSDVAFIPYPTLEEKVHIIENTVEVAHACGVEMPKVAPLAAVEVVNAKMPCTIEAAKLTEMNNNGLITGCIVDGPLSLDLAIEPEAAKHKGAEGRKIVGDADILLFPDIQAGNITYKCMSHTTAHRSGCILTGTSAPAILTSRSDDTATKVNSIALAAVVAQQIEKSKSAILKPQEFDILNPKVALATVKI